MLLAIPSQTLKLDCGSLQIRVPLPDDNTKNIQGKFSILFLPAGPTDTSRLRLGEEVREIEEKIQLSKLRERLELHQ
jgi:hypothetical protein